MNKNRPFGRLEFYFFTFLLFWLSALLHLDPGNLNFGQLLTMAFL